MVRANVLPKKPFFRDATVATPFEHITCVQGVPDCHLKHQTVAKPWQTKSLSRVSGAIVDESLTSPAVGSRLQSRAPAPETFRFARTSPGQEF